MACGCGGNPSAAKINAGVCLACGDAAAGLTVCSIDGQPLTAHAMRGSCPAGRHLSKQGTVQWLGIRWYGLPWPIKAACRWFLGRLVLGGGSVLAVADTGCGCTVRLKHAWAIRHARRQPIALGHANGAADGIEGGGERAGDGSRAGPVVVRDIAEEREPAL